MYTNAQENTNQSVRDYLKQRSKTVSSQPKSTGRIETTLIPAHKLKVCQFTQRPLRSKKHAEWIANNFDSNLFDPLVVSYRDGVYYVIDGQHRLYAVKKLFGNDYLVECRIMKGLTLQEEAKLFVDLNGCSKVLQYTDKAKGLYYSGDKTMSDLMNICKRYGVELGIDDDKRQVADGRIVAIKALVDTYNKIGYEQTARLVHLINDTWDGKADGFKGEIIKATAVILSLYSDELNDSLFIKKLSKADPVSIIRMAKNDIATKAKTEVKMARIMITNYYNKGRGAKPVEYRFNV